MFTSYDKAITALIMAVISIVSLWFGWSSAGDTSTAADATKAVTDAVAAAGAAAGTVSETVKKVQDVVTSVSTIPDTIATISTVLSPLLVWLVPNKK